MAAFVLAGADPVRKDLRWGNSAFHYGASAGDTDCLEVLATAQAPPAGLVNNHGKLDLGLVIAPHTHPYVSLVSLMQFLRRFGPPMKLFVYPTLALALT